MVGVTLRPIPRAAPLYIHLVWWVPILVVGFIVWTVFSARSEFAASEAFSSSGSVAAVCVAVSLSVGALLLCAAYLRNRWERQSRQGWTDDVVERTNREFADFIAPVAATFVTYYLLQPLALGPILHGMSRPDAYSGTFAVVQRTLPSTRNGCENIGIRNAEVGLLTICGNRYGLNVLRGAAEVTVTGTRSWSGLEIHSVRPLPKG